MSISSDTQYFTRRAEESRLAAANATNRDAAVIHGELTTAYEILADKAAIVAQGGESFGDIAHVPSPATLERWVNEGGTPPT